MHSLGVSSLSKAFPSPDTCQTTVSDHDVFGRWLTRTPRRELNGISSRRPRGDGVHGVPGRSTLTSSCI